MSEFESKRKGRRRSESRSTLPALVASRLLLCTCTTSNPPPGDGFSLVTGSAFFIFLRFTFCQMPFQTQLKLKEAGSSTSILQLHNFISCGRHPCHCLRRREQRFVTAEMWVKAIRTGRSTLTMWVLLRPFFARSGSLLCPFQFLHLLLKILDEFPQLSAFTTA